MRVVKEAEERKNEILDKADQLFSRKGFEGTSTNDILEAVGIARGTLYYHFKSKEDIMDALIERYNQQILNAAKQAAQNQKLTVYERIIKVVLSMNISQYSQESEGIIEQIHKPQNILMHQKIQKVIIHSITPILSDLIKEGIGLGLFDTPVPYECMEMFMVYATTLLDSGIIELTEEEQGSRMQAMMINMERMLGCKQGSLKEQMSLFEVQ
ncbi:MAG: TetR/AcrR family transcriptional regulator [Cellulosilyticum sp.]|nr:TetR/AcrR family transcriptional regulator [Cellulosilyticum sp.]